MLGFPLGILSAAGAGGVVPAYELISTTILGTTESSVVFSSLGDYSSIYKHLQVRIAARDNQGATGNVLYGRLNADTGNNYTGHGIAGDGSSVASFRTAETNFFHAGIATSNSATTNTFRVTVLDILDAYSTTKNTTTRSLTGGAEGTGQNIRLYSGLWLNTASITTLTFIPGGGASFVAGSRFSLYGIKG
jgi:hypothetical protein